MLDEAIEAFNKATSLQPDYAEAYPNLSAVLREQGKLDGAIEACNMAISLKSDLAEAYYNFPFPIILKVIFKRDLNYMSGD